MPIKYTVSQWNKKKIIIGETDMQATKPATLLIGLHGAESTPENMLVLGNQLELSNTLFIFPEGPVDADNERWSWWLDGPKQKESVCAFIEFISDVIETAGQHMQDKYNISSYDTCLWGFSQGAAAALVYALQGKHSIAKIASVCGFLPELPDGLAKNLPSTILGIFGSNDDVVPAFLAEHALDELKANDHKVTVNETSQGHEITEENLKQICNFLINS